MTDFGGKLRQAREQRGVSLRQIAANTKISVGVLEALERNDVSKLPGGIFGRGFVRSYALEVGLDPDQTVAEYVERFHAEEAPEPAVHVVSEEERAIATERHAAGMAVRAILALLLFGGIFLFFALRWGDQAASSAGSTAPATPRSEVATTPPPTAGQPGAAPATDDALRATGPMRLELHPTGPCWVKLSVDGRDVLARLMQPGQKEVLTVREVAVISIGDAGAFAFSVDGHPGRALGSPGEVKTVRITRESLPDYLR